MNGIGGALVSAVADLEGPILLLVALFCYLAALVVFVQGCTRLVRYSEGGPAAQSLWGIGVTFAVAAALVSLPGVLEGAGETLFAGLAPGGATLGYGGRSADYEQLLGAVFAIVQIVGLVAFVQGMFVLRGASDGQPGATVSRAAMHMVGGLLGWHILAVLGGVQETLGISVLKIS